MNKKYSIEGEKIVSPFSLLLILIIFSKIIYCQSYTGLLFKQAGQVSRSENAKYHLLATYYDIYQHRINNEIIDRLYVSSITQKVNIPVSQKIKLDLDNSREIYHCETKPDSSEEFYFHNMFNNWGISITRLGDWQDLTARFYSTTDKARYGYLLAFVLRYKNYSIKGAYKSDNCLYQSEFSGDSTTFSPKLFLDITTGNLKIEHRNERLHWKILTSVSSSSDKEKIKNTGSLRLVPDVQIFKHSFEFAYKTEKSLTLLTSGLFRYNDNNVPIFWQGSGLGKFTTANDTLKSIILGAAYRGHNFSIGRGQWCGSFRLSTAVYPFVSIWESLAGGRFYLRANGSLDFYAIFYSYLLKRNTWQLQFKMAYLNFWGDIFEKSYCLFFPFQVRDIRSLSIDIATLQILEIQPVLTIRLGKYWQTEIQADALIPVKKRLTVVPEQEIIPRGGKNEHVHGGLQFQLMLSYLF